LFDLYMPICDYWMIFNNSTTPSQLIAEGYSDKEVQIKNAKDFTVLKNKIYYDKAR
jgi:predicted ABC-type ATPase